MEFRITKKTQSPKCEPEWYTEKKVKFGGSSFTKKWSSLYLNYRRKIVNHIFETLILFNLWALF